MRKSRVAEGIGIALIAIMAFFVVGFVLMSLWNWLMPALFGLRVITFWQAVGLFILGKLLFGGFRGGPGRRHWRHRMEERWEQMTPQEREKFREGMQRGWCRRAADEPKTEAAK
jgi:hypothetical protein